MSESGRPPTRNSDVSSDGADRGPPTTALHADSREIVFQQAINLMSERCPSMNQAGRDSTFSRGRTPLSASGGMVTTKYFYVEQKTPTPMPPLQAWRGYHGNVYFEPIKVGQAPEVSEKDKDTPRDQIIPEKCSPALKQILESRHKHKTPARGGSALRTQSALAAGARGGSPARIMSPDRSRTSLELRHTSPSRASARTTASNLSYGGPRQMSILDKSAILDRENEKIREDLTWVFNQESTGSLCIQPMPRNKHEARKKAPAPAPQLDKEKICRGSVAHKIYAMKNQRIPLLSVTGDRFQHSTLPNALMRTQTQYSRSSKRMTMNSPDQYHVALMQGGYDKFQPLEQLRASLKQIEHSGNPETNMFTIPAMDRIKFEDPDLSLKNKPYVKYTPELKNSIGRSSSVQRPAQKVIK